MEPNLQGVLVVLLLAVISDLATGLGVLPVLWMKGWGRKWEAITSAAAAGMMAAASFYAIGEALFSLHGTWDVGVGILVGVVFFFVVEKITHNGESKSELFQGVGGRHALLLVIALTIHSIPEGVAVGVGFATGELGFGLILAIAIALHNVPEGIAVSLPLRARGASGWKCFWLAVLTSVPQPIFAVPAFLLVSWAQTLLPAGLAFAGGAMLWLVVTELLPDASEIIGRKATAVGFVVGLGLMGGANLAMAFSF